MKKFGRSKKDEGGDEDTNRLALFGSRNKSKSPAPSDNPYAQAFPPDPYTAAKINAGVAPSASIQAPAGRGLPSGPKGGFSSGPKASYGGNMNGPAGQQSSGQTGGMDDKYGSRAGGYDSGRYGAEKYSNQGGYGGGNPYGQQRESTRPGGYGGLGRTQSLETTDTDDNRDLLFGGAGDRFQQKQQSRPPPYGEAQSGQDGYSNQQSYGAYGADRQLTAEEEEQEDIEATKQEIRFMKQSDVSSTRNALRVAAQAEETGRNTLARLGAQGERIHNTERNLDLAANSNRVAEERARELKKLNRSMFAVQVGNPFTSSKRAEERDRDIMQRHQDERDQREATRKAAFASGQRMQSNFKQLGSGEPGAPTKGSLAARAKYQFEADSEDDDMENEIDQNLDQLSGAASRLNLLAKATGTEVEAQNRHLERIAGKSDFVDDQIHMNRQRLDRIK